MNRSNYSTDLDNWDLIRWRGAVASAIRGKRGQAVLREILAALDAIPEKRLIANALAEDGCYCALGALGAARGLDLSQWDPYDIDPGNMAELFGIPRALAAEIMFENDGGTWPRETPEDRWRRMRDWVSSLIKAGAESR